MLNPFIRPYGGKHGIAHLYGPPRCNHVMEVFAGGFAYSCHWEPRDVTLIEKDDVNAELLDYLIHVSSTEIMRLPTNISHIDELKPCVPRPAKTLIGFWFNRNPARPVTYRSPWAQDPNQQTQFWSETIRFRIASQVDRIRHWKIIHGSYEEAPDVEAHWFIDPPYSSDAGRAYRHNQIDYKALAKWCRSRRGFVQVCEEYGANWLPFDPLTIVVTHRKRGYLIEALCEIDNRPRQSSK